MGLSHRFAFLALTLVAVATAGCPEQQLVALRPDFAIEWPQEQGWVEDDLDASRLDFGAVTTGGSASIPVVLSNPGNAGLDVCGVYVAAVTFDEEGQVVDELRLEALGADVTSELFLSPPNISELTRIDDGQTVNIELRYTPLFGTALDARLHLVVHHERNSSLCDGNGEGLYIPIAGEGNGDPMPDIYAKPAKVVFQDTLQGEVSETVEVFVGNAGPGLLNISTVALDDDTHFSLDASQLVGAGLTTGATASIFVQFRPQALGELSASVMVSSNDPDEAPLLIPLFGVGESTPLGKGPQAVCGSDYSIGTLTQMTFDGSASYDTDGLPLTFQWQLTPPPGSAALMTPISGASAVVSVNGDLAGDYVGTLTVRNTNNQTDTCSQTITAVPNENFRVELFWAYSGDDMDLHLLRPGGTPRTDGDCYYANCQGTWSALDWGVNGYADDDPTLDLDDIPGTGPENINIADPATGAYAGDYIVFVHDYPGSVYQSSNDVTVNVYLNGNLAQTFTFQLSGEDDDYYVARINWPSGAITPCSGLGGC